MKKSLILGIFVPLFTIMSFKLISLNNSQEVTDADIELSLYDINFIKEDRTRTLPTTELINHSEGQKKFTLNNLKGKPIIIHFWGTNCRPCAHELPHYQKFVKKYPEIVNIPLTITPLRSQSEKEIKAGLAQFGAPDLPLIIDEKAKLAAFFEVMAIPTTVFINSLGNIVGSIMGPVDWTDQKVVDLILETLKV